MRQPFASLFFVALIPCFWFSQIRADEVAFFEKEIRPLLVEHCYECHSAASGKSKGGLRLDARESMRRGGEHGPAVVPHQIESSLLIQAVRYRDKELEMPPSGPLPKEAVKKLEQWIAAGAFDPREDVSGAVAHQIGPDFEKARRHWAFQPISDHPPRVETGSWVRNEIDTFVVEKLREKGWEPGPEADPRTLVRRLYFDLIGLPPSHEQVQSYLNDKRPDRFEHLVDRLLDSPHYGERWGRHWLDVARYADTEDALRPNYERRYPFAYTYRNWVIQALNDDMPFDRFIQLQLAADHIEGIDSESPNLAALGFLTVGRRFNGSPELILDDQIDLVGRGLQGLTLACARCHDHKTDPIPTADYYSLSGIFGSSLIPLDLPKIGEEPDHDPKKAADYAERRRKHLAAFDAYVIECRDDANQHFREVAGGYLRYLAMSSPNHKTVDGEPPITTPEGILRPGNEKRYRRLLLDTKESDEPFFRLWHLCEAADPVSLPRVAKMWSDRDDAHPVLRAMVKERRPNDFVGIAEIYRDALKKIGEQPGDPESSRILALCFGEGSPLHATTKEVLDDSERNLITRQLVTRKQSMKFTNFERGMRGLEVDAPVKRAMVLRPRPEPVEPVVLLRGNENTPGERVPRRFLQVLEPDVQPWAGPYEGDGRLEVARAITSQGNPLTARVLVNRIWALHFGRGLVPSLDNFGVGTPEPSHPALLDYLAAKLIREGGSLKKLHRHILLSATWRQTSSTEGRTEAAALDPENVFLWRQNRRRLEFEPMRDSLLMASGKLDLTAVGPSKPLGAGNSFRSVYAFIDRFENQPELRAFDVPLAETANVKRAQTVIPQQALYWMNHPFVAEQAELMVARTTGAPEERARQLYRLALGREAEPEEVKEAVSFVAERTPESLTWLAQALFMSNEFLYVD